MSRLFDSPCEGCGKIFAAFLEMKSALFRFYCFSCRAKILDEYNRTGILRTYSSMVEQHSDIVKAGGSNPSASNNKTKGK